MLSVSDGFKAQLNNDKRQFLYRLTVTLADTTQLTLTNQHLWSNSLRFSGATSGNGTFDVGAFVIGRLSFIINDIYDNFGDSYDFNKAQVNLEIGLSLANNTTEYLQIGKYVVDSVSYSGMLITLDCLDFGYYFDTDWDTNLTFPTTSGAVVREACTRCGITLATQSWDGINTVIQKKPDDKNLTWRAAIGYAIQLGGQFARMNPNGQLVIGWYDIDHLAQVTVDGSLLDAHDARILDHIDDPILVSNRNAVADAWNALSTANKNRYARLRHISRVNVGHYPILITGVKCTVGRGDNAQSYSTGSSEYVIDVSENPFIDNNNASSVITAIGGNTVGFYFYTFDATYLSMPHYEPGDLCWIEDAQKGRVYCSFITNFEFTAGSYQSSSCGAETPAQKATAPYTPSMRILAEAGRATRASLDSYESVAKNMAELISNGMGMYFTREPQADGSNIYYMHDKPTMSASDTIWKVTSQGFLASTDHGVTWAVDRLGNALYNVITARGLNADWINTGAFTVEDGQGNVTFSADKDTGAVVINATSFSLQGASIAKIARDNVNVGGRNLLLDTQDVRESPASVSGDASVAGFLASEYGETYLSTSGQVLTIGFNYEVTGNSNSNAKVAVYCNRYGLSVDPDSIYGTSYKKSVYPGATGVYRQTFILTSTQASDSSNFILIRLENATDGAKIKVWNVKLEVGDVATDWSPAPEDFAAEIEDKVDNAIDLYDVNLDQTNVFNKLTNNSANQGIYLDNRSVYINSSYIKTGIFEVWNNSGNQSVRTFYANSNTGVVQIVADTFSLSNGSTIDSIAQDKVDALDGSLTQTDVFNRLTNNSANQGIYLSNGTLYINASYIKTGTLEVGGANNGKGLIHVLDANDNLVGGINNTETYNKNPSNNDKVSMKTGGLYFYRNTSTEVGSICRYTNGNKNYLQIYGRDSVDIISKGEIVLRTEDANNVYPGLTVRKNSNYPIVVNGNAKTQYYVEIPTSIDGDGKVLSFIQAHIVGGIVYNR